MSQATGSNSEAFGGGGDGQNGQGVQNSLQQQLVQQLSQQFTQQMSQKFPPNDLLSALATVQAQMQPQQQPQTVPVDIMALARQANLGGLLSPSSNGATLDALTGSTRKVPADAPAAAAAAVASAPTGTAANTSGNNDGHSGAGFTKGLPSNDPVNNATSDTAKDERKKAPGSVIVPCRARGMPMDHNFKTAYFVIPENVRHGEELICSYFACRNAGVKFRYCSHCKVPVAKRNFRKRHKHGASGRDGDNDDASEDGGSEEGEPAAMVVLSEVVAGSRIGMKDSIPNQITTFTESERENKKRPKERSLIGSEVTTTITDSTQEGKAPHKKVASEKDAAILDGDRAEGDERVNAVESRRKHWESLLEKRPQTKDGEAMTSWLMQVLAVSDLGKTLSDAEELPTTPLDAIREDAGADTKLSMEGNSTPPAASNGDAKDDSGSRDNGQDTTSDNSENQGGNDIKHLPNESGTVDECGDENPNEPNTKKSELIEKKRPVADMEKGDDDSAPPSSKSKL